MTDERLGMATGAMLRDIDRPPRDPGASVDVVMAQVHDTRQARPWWPFGRTTRTAIPASGRPPAGGSAMFSTLKLVVAGAIVALFGGFLLAGIITTPQDGKVPPAAGTASPWPKTTDELLSTIVTEEVEPGVLRIVNDGYRDLGTRHHLPDLAEAVVVDDAGDVWRVMPDRDDWSATYVRLGVEGELRIEPGSPESEELGLAALTVEVTPDGRLAVGESVVERLLDEGSLAPEELGWDGPYTTEIEFEDDGTAWLLGAEGALVRVRPDATPEVIDWQSVYDGEIVGPLSVTADGEAWLMGRPATDRDLIEVLLIDAFLHFDGSEWEVVAAPDGLAREGSLGIAFDVGPDGTLWTVGDATSPHRRLARYDGSDWTIFGEAEGVRRWGGQAVGVYGAPVGMLRVAPDESVWVNAAGPGDRGCGGLGRYDGATWTSFLPGMCVSDYDFAPDGAVWVVATDATSSIDEDTAVETQTLVITPEAVSGSG